MEEELEVVEAPREGTLAWLQLQEHVLVEGLSVPACHRIPEAAVLAEPNGSLCRLVIAGQRCRATPTRAYGICVGHLGGGGWRDSEGARRHSQMANRRKAVLRERRQTLGIGARRSGDARQIARVEALERAQDVARALLAPLDDEALGSMAQQRAAVTILDATFPLATTTVELEIPADEAGVQALGWAQLQQLAGTLLVEHEEYQVVPALPEPL